jgi:hypothetical protein
LYVEKEKKGIGPKLKTQLLFKALQVSKLALKMARKSDSGFAFKDRG